MTEPKTWTLSESGWRDGASIPVTDRGFRYGMHVFETFAVFRGKLLLAPDHVDRLRRAGEAAGFTVPDGLGGLLEALPLAGATGMLRIYVTAGDGGFLESGAGGRVYGFFEGAVFPDETRIISGIHIGVSRAPVAAILGGWKTGNYWQQVQALQEAKQQGLDEILVMNMQGELVSAAMANLFLVLDGVIRTPSLSSGARDGVVRAWVARQMPVRETSLVPEDIEKADECFITNSRIGVMPVTQIEGCGLPSIKTGETLALLYREEILHH